MPHHTVSPPPKKTPEIKTRKNYSRLQIVRYVSLILSSVFLVFFSFNDFPVLFPALLIATVLGGSFFCGWICPMGFLQDLAGFIARRFKVTQQNLLPRRVHLILMPLRYLLFGAVYMGIAFTSFYIFNADARRSALTLLAVQVPVALSLIILAVFLGLSVFYKRVFCSYFCVEGAKQGLVGILRPVTILRNTDTCINCKKCDKACPMSISVSTSGNVQSPQCVNCFQCITACPCEKTLVFGIARPKHDPLGTLLGKGKPLAAPLRFGLIALRLALAAAAFAFWFTGPGSDTYAPRFETVPHTLIETGASAQEMGAQPYDAGSGASAAYEESETEYAEEAAEEAAE